MNRRKKDIIILAILLPVLILLLFARIGGRGKENSKMQISQDKKNTMDNSIIISPLNESIVKDEKILKEQIALENKYIESGIIRDPFQNTLTDANSNTAGTAKSVILNLTGILVGDEIGAPRQAIINGKIVSIGNTIQGFKILEIKQDEVILTKENETIRLKIGKSIKKNPEGTD